MPLSLKIIQVILISSVKFLFAPPVALSLGFNFWQTILLTSTGGILGIILFYFLSTGILKLYRYILKRLRTAFSKDKSSAKKKKHFPRRNKLIIRLRGKIGMYGLIVLTPCILSIPLGCFLVNKYYSRNKYVVLYLCIAIILWSVVLSSAYFFFEIG